MKYFRFLAVSSSLLAVMLLAGCGGSERGENQSSGSAAKKAATQVASNTDVHPGKALHDSNCISCHDATAYTREDRKIADFPQLLAQVKRCDANLGSRLFDEEIKQVVGYLNQAYYKYPQ